MNGGVLAGLIVWGAVWLAVVIVGVWLLWRVR